MSSSEQTLLDGTRFISEDDMETNDNETSMDITTANINMIRRLYPAQSTIHDIAAEAIQSNDTTTVNQLISYPSYLPIRWDILIPYKKISTPEPQISDNTYIQVLEWALTHDNIDIVRMILNVYSIPGSEEDLLLLTYAYPRVKSREYALVSKTILDYLISSGWISASLLLLAIVRDDPSILIDTPILQREEAILILKYDSINMYKRYMNISYININQDIGPMIKYWVLSSMKTDGNELIIKSLIRDTANILPIHMKNREIRIYSLQYAATKGAIEILDKYLINEDILAVLAYPISDTNKERIVDLLNYKYQRHEIDINGSMFQIIWFTEDIFLVPEWLWYGYLEMTIVYNNIDLINHMIALSPELKDEMRSIALKYHIMNKNILEPILNILS